MKYSLKSVCLCLALYGVSACSNNDESMVLQGSGEAVVLNAQIEQSSLPRTTTGGEDYKTTVWATGDRVRLNGTAGVPPSGGGSDIDIPLGPGIYQYQPDATWAYTDGTQPIIWRASTIKVSGIFPAIDTHGNEVTTQAFTLGTDQQTVEKQGKNDYMAADETEQSETTNSKQISLTFKHQLAQLAITIASIGTEYKDVTISKVEVRSKTVLSGTTWATPTYITACGSTTGNKNAVYIALVAPEKLKDVSITNPFIQVTLSNSTVVNLSTLPPALTFVKGQQHTLVLHVGHDEITVDANSISIGDWGSNTDVTGDKPGDTDEEVIP